MSLGLFLLYAGLFIGCSGYSHALDFTAEATTMDSETAVIAFASNGTKNSDAFVVVNINNKPQKIAAVSPPFSQNKIL